VESGRDHGAALHSDGVGLEIRGGGQNTDTKLAAPQQLFIHVPALVFGL